MATTNYPGGIDNYPAPLNLAITDVSSHWYGPALAAIETELGTDPAGYATDVKTRLSDINPSEGNLNLDAGYGSKAPIYGVRAWVNFDGTSNTGGNCTIRASGNVSSVTDNGVGDYTVNFATAMPDLDYAVSGLMNPSVSNAGSDTFAHRSVSGPAFARVKHFEAGVPRDSVWVSVIIIR